LLSSEGYLIPDQIRSDLLALMLAGEGYHLEFKQSLNKSFVEEAGIINILRPFYFLFFYFYGAAHQFTERT
jgi:hypothetical protein